MAQASNWEIVQRWLHAVPFGRTDPVFGHDLGFYVFNLPFYGLLRDWCLVILFLAVVTAGAIYWVRGAVQVDEGFPHIPPGVIRHLSVVLAMFFLVKAADYVLQR